LTPENTTMTLLNAQQHPLDAIADTLQIVNGKLAHLKINPFPVRLRFTKQTKSLRGIGQAGGKPFPIRICSSL
jgi:hypothetical protein